MEYYVYFLIDPRDDSVFYVGKGCKNRMYHHVKNVRGGFGHKNKKLFNKINKILNLNLKVKYKKVFTTYDESEAYDKEREIINEFGLSNLCNILEGGSGGFTSEQQRLNAIKSNEKQRILSETDPKWKANKSMKVSQSLKEQYECGIRERKQWGNWEGRKHTEITKKRISSSKKGKFTGKDNSQFGTCWITKDGNCKKVKKELLQNYLELGWSRGRK